MEKLLQKNFTQATYDKAARGYADKFEHIGARVEDVDRAVALIDKINPTVIEIGCGGVGKRNIFLQKLRDM